MTQKQTQSLCFANFIVISLIPIAFFMAIFLGYIGLIPLHVPVHSLGVIGFILFIFLLFAKHNANYSVCKMRSSLSHLESELETELQKSALCIENETKSVLNIHNFMNKYYSNIRNDNFVSVASSIFPMLGILGTFVAIALSMPNFSVSDTEALDHEITLLLSGVGSAFFASIYGILLSLIWTYFEKRGLSKIEIYYNSIKEDFHPHIWSTEELTIYKYTQYGAKEDKLLTALHSTLNIDFIKEMNEQHLQSFESVMQETNKNFLSLSTNLKSVSSELRATLKEMDTSKSALQAQNSINKSLDNFTEATHSLEKTTKVFTAQLDNSLNRTFDKIDTEIGDIVIKLADFATHVSLESREVQDSISKYHYMVANHINNK